RRPRGVEAAKVIDAEALRVTGGEVGDTGNVAGRIVRIPDVGDRGGPGGAGGPQLREAARVRVVDARDIGERAAVVAQVDHRQLAEAGVLGAGNPGARRGDQGRAEAGRQRGQLAKAVV